ncbi:hypothetical protein ACQKPX_14145 [Photobacterium sp. DNB23_23_1]
MVVMFIPLKLLFVLSGTKNIAALENIESTIGRNTYVILMIALVVFLYLFNTALQVYKGKIINNELKNIEVKAFNVKGKSIPYKVINRTFPTYCQVLSDIMLVVFITALFFIVNLSYALYFSCVTGLYFIIVEYWAFSDHETRLLRKLHINNKQFIHAFSGLFYLVMFIGIAIVVLVSQLNVLIAIMMLLLARLANGSLKSFFIGQLSLRFNYLS